MKFGKEFNFNNGFGATRIPKMEEGKKGERGKAAATSAAGGGAAQEVATGERYIVHAFAVVLVC